MTHKPRPGNTGRSAASFNADPAVRVGNCEPCGKYIYLSRKTARITARRVPSEGGIRPRAYPCPINEQHWHVGHIPTAVRQGEITRDDWDKQRGLRRWAP